MKKLGIVLCLPLIVLTSLPTFAAVDVPLFEDTFVRGTGTPVTETRTFPGISGPAMITLWNGGAADFTAKKVSSSDVRVNGVLVFGPHNFNQNVGLLQAGVTLKEGDNSLEVVLKSKPGGKVKIQIVQTVNAEAAAIIGPAGGVIEITDSQSPIFGAKIEIPENALISQQAIISLS